MPFIGIGFLGASSVSSKTGIPQWEPYVPVTDDSDVEPFGPTAVYQALGVSSLPYPKDDTGYAECLYVKDVGGRVAVCVGGIDTRSAKIVGSLQPGDTVLHTTGPQQAAQVQLKEKTRVAAVVTKNSSGKTMLLALDGTNDKAQFTANGAMIEEDQDGNISIINSYGAGFLIQGGNVHIIGNPVLGAGNPAGLCLMLGPPTGSPGGPASVPLFPAKGITPGT